MIRKLEIIWLLFLIIVNSELFPSEKTIKAEKLMPGEVIIIDGKPDDPVWQRAQKAGGFIQREPEEGKPGSESTYFQVAYDNKFLYVFVYCYDSKPDKIKAYLTRRDSYSSSDWVAVSIDSYNDNRTAFEFRINPIGVKMDMIRFDDNNSDRSWDPIWFCDTRIDTSGWFVEFKIPMKELRFSNNNTGQWGIQVYRQIARKNERQYWTYWSKNETGWVSHYGNLIGITDIPRQKRIYLYPYTLGGINLSNLLRTEAHKNNYDILRNFGLDAKIGITNNLTMDMTVNPDFGQVEADPGVLNLTAFETFYPEKRPFFIEGRNIFNFSLGIGDGDLSRNSLFYSRRIGRAPQRDVESDISSDTVYCNQPDWTTILFASKVTGKTNNGISIGILNAQTDREYAYIRYKSGRKEKEVVEPMTNYTVARLQKDFRNGNTTLGGILTYTYRKIDDPALNFLRDRALTMGFDFTNLFWNRNYMIDFALAYSYVHGSNEAMIETQQSSARYFQRPDAKHVNLDSNRTFLTGYANKIAFGKIAGGHFRFASGLVTSSPGFEINDLGYMQQVDQIIHFTWVAFVQTNPKYFYREYQINFNQWSAFNFEKINLGNGGNVNFHIEFKNYWELHTGYNIELSGISTNALRGGPSIKYPRSHNYWFGIKSDYRKNIAGNVFLGQSKSKDNSYSRWINPHLTLRPHQNMRISIEPSYRIAVNNWMWVDCFEVDNKNHYIFSKIEQKVISCQMRLDYTLTPNLSLQFYCEPFIATGKYSEFKEVNNPRADKFDKRFYTYSPSQINYDEENEVYNIDIDTDGNTDISFDNPNFNYRQYRSNLVIRWEYSPGSLLYIVWSQNIDSYDSFGIFDFDRELKSLRKAAPFNTIMLKLSYLINF